MRRASCFSLLRRVAALAAAALIALAETPATAERAAERVDLELVLLADATGSIDEAEIQFQRQGYADALTSPALIDAMTGGAQGRVALAYVEWADADSQDIVVDWTIIDGPASAAAFGERLMAAPRRAYGRNAIGSALSFALAMIENNALDGARKVIDFSGDSANSWDNIPIETARDAAVAAGATINGLAILCRVCSGRPISYDLEKAFLTRIIGGPGAFVITADSRETFADAVRAKLFLEVSGETRPTVLAEHGARQTIRVASVERPYASSNAAAD